MSPRPGLTFDTGVLIALERRTQRATEVYRAAADGGALITVPTAVIAEWWRGRTDLRERLLAGVRVELLTPQLAKVAGEAMAAVRKATLVDSLVMASAATRGDIVYTSDIEDLVRLQAHFPTVRILQI